MNILITGADGFIGSHLTEYLVQEGYTVKALTQYNAFNSWGWLDNSPFLPDIEVLSGDIRDPYYCLNITKGIDVILHLAALIAIPYSYIAPQSYVETNVTGTLNLCQAALTNNVGRIIHTSTSEVYGSARYVPIDEQHPLQPQSPYSASKIAADAMAMSYFNTFQLPLTIARPFNTYGPRQSARAVIPTIITQIAQGHTNISLGDLSPTRDFNYVSDTCRGFLALMRCEKAIGETVNIGSNYEISIGDTLTLIQTLMNKGSAESCRYVQDTDRIRPQKSEVTRLWCDNKKITDLTGFVPQVSLEQGLQKTIAWFTEKDNLAKYKAGIYNV